MQISSLRSSFSCVGRFNCSDSKLHYTLCMSVPYIFQLSSSNLQAIDPSQPIKVATELSASHTLLISVLSRQQPSRLQNLWPTGKQMIGRKHRVWQISHPIAPITLSGSVRHKWPGEIQKFTGKIFIILSPFTRISSPIQWNPPSHIPPIPRIQLTTRSLFS